MFIPVKPGSGRGVLNGAIKQGWLREVAKRPSDPGALSFGYFSLGTQRKVTRHKGETNLPSRRISFAIKANSHFQSGKNIAPITQFWYKALLSDTSSTCQEIEMSNSTGNSC